MNVKNFKNICLLLFLFSAAFSVATPQTSQPDSVQELVSKPKYLIKLKDGVTADQLKENGVDGRDIVIIKEYQSIRAVLVEFVDDFEIDDLDDLMEDDQVDSVTVDQYRQWLPPSDPEIIEDDEFETDGPSVTIPPGLSRIGADHFDYTRTVDATIAIIDTGIDPKHENLNLIKGINFIEPGKPQADEDGHGTHVAGTAAAKATGQGQKSLVGVAPGARLIALKVFDSDGYTYDSVIIDAIDWVTQHADEVDVVNMSLGGVRGWGFDLMHEAIKESISKGVVYVVAAGNEERNIYFMEGYGYNTVPAAYPEVMTVSAMVATDGFSGGFGKMSYWGKDDTFAGFSNYSERPHPNNPVYSPGACIDVAAPGVNILSTWPGNRFAKLDGTSMASPHVAGVVARYIEKNRDHLFPGGVKTAEAVYQIRQVLINNAEPQESWNENHLSNDPDPYHEGLVQVVE